MFPPEEVKPNETVKFGSCSTTLFSGTRASVTFTVDGLELEKDLWFRWEFVSFGVYRSSFQIYSFGNIGLLTYSCYEITGIHTER
jgi:hypothetical protein